MEVVADLPKINTVTPEFQTEDENTAAHSPSEIPDTPPITTAAAETEDTPREHVRAPGLKRYGSKLLMSAAAVIGAAAGARLVFGMPANAALENISQSFSGDFSTIFFGQAVLSAVFLGVEFILGFFAFGDLLVWTAPFLCAAGTVLRIAASSPRLIPGAVLCLGAVVFGAAHSADMSELLLRLSRGGTVYMESRPQRTYALSFLGCLTAAVLGALLAAFLV